MFKLVLQRSHIIKSEWANEQFQHTILLTPDNNHFEEISKLERADLINIHPQSKGTYPIYIADRTLMRKDYLEELRKMFGLTFDGLDPLLKEVLGVVYRFNHYSKQRIVSAKLASFSLWEERGGGEGGIKAFDAFYRKVRNGFNKLEKQGFVQKHPGSRKYVLGDSGSVGGLPPATS
jgi:hypothetical protein